MTAQPGGAGAPGAAPGEPAAGRTGEGPHRPDPGTRWHRVHPVTPALRAWKVLAVLFVVAVQQLGDNLELGRELVQGRRLLLLALGFLVVTLVGFVYSLIAWRMTRYAVDAESVHLHTGVLFRQQRRARLDRLQAVDVRQPLLARLFGLAELKLEVAGGSGSGVTLAFLRESEAQQLRDELLARAAGLELPAPSADGEAVVAPRAPERHLFSVEMPVLLGSIVRSGAPYLLVVGVAILVVVMIMTRSLASALALIPMVFGVGSVVWQRFVREANFQAATSADGIRLRHGLLEVRAQTIPPDRVQAVRLEQPLLWRGKDWWRVQVNVAGYGIEDQATASVLLPVGSRDDALLALWLVLPDLGVDDPRALLDQALSGSGPEGGFTVSPRRARWLSPLSWRRNGFVVTDQALLLRSRRLGRRLDVVPHARTQSLGVEQGPLARRLRLAAFVVHSTPGPVSPRLANLDSAQAGALLLEQADRARTARAQARPEQWMRRPTDQLSPPDPQPPGQER